MSRILYVLLILPFDIVSHVCQFYHSEISNGEAACGANGYAIGSNTIGGCQW